MVVFDINIELNINSSDRVSHTSETLINNQQFGVNQSFIPTRGCSSGSFCNETEDYPQFIVNIVRSIEEDSPLRDLFNQRARNAETESKLNHNKVPILSEDTSATLSPESYDDHVLTRTNIYSSPMDPLLEEPMCAERIDYIYPKKAQTKYKEWRFVVNLPEENGSANFVQAVRVKTCMSEGEACSAPICHARSTVCRQEYDYTRLLAVSETGSQYVEDFTFPSGCKCYQSSMGYSGYRYELARTEERNEILTELEDEEESLSKEVDENMNTPRHLKGRKKKN